MGAGGRAPWGNETMLRKKGRGAPKITPGNHSVPFEDTHLKAGYRILVWSFLPQLVLNLRQLSAPGRATLLRASPILLLSQRPPCHRASPADAHLV